MFQETHRRNVRWGASDSLIMTDRCPPNESLPHYRRLPLNSRRTSASEKSSSADITLSRHCGIFFLHAHRPHHFNCADVPRGHGCGEFQPSRIAESKRTIRSLADLCGLTSAAPLFRPQHTGRFRPATSGKFSPLAFCRRNVRP